MKVVYAFRVFIGLFMTGARMSKVIPFRALVPTVEAASKVLSPPFDVVSRGEAYALGVDNPLSFLHVIRSEIDLDPEVDEYSDEVYRKAASNLHELVDRGYLVESDPSFYVYRQIMDGHCQTGLVCGVSVEEYENGLIKKHERTREQKVVDRTRHTFAVGAHTEAAMLVHRAAAPIFHLIDETEARVDPLIDVTDASGVRHLLWRARNTLPLQKVFEGIPSLYIADGHHRCEAALKVRDIMRKENPGHTGDESYNYFPAVIYPDDEVRVFEYNWDDRDSQRPLSTYSMCEIMQITDEGGIMPPKTTWFAPKLGSGLFVYMLQENRDKGRGI